MKKLLFLFVSTVLFSCSGDDNNDSTNTDSSDMNPPAWAQGTWLMEVGGASTGLKFTTDDVCSVVNSTTTCNKENLSTIKRGGGHVAVEETISDTKYIVNITIQSNTTTYNIEKVSATQIKWNLSSTSSATLTKQP